MPTYTSQCRLRPFRRNVLVTLMFLLAGACGPQAEQQGLLEGANPSGESPWLAAERQRFVELLSASSVDVVVVPFQAAGYSFDTAERTLLATRTGDYIAAHTGLSVADPQLVGRALGEGWRRLDPADIQALATAMQASHVVIGEIGHDRNSTFNVTIQTWSSDHPGRFDEDVTRNEQSWELAFSPAEFPHQVFVDVLPEVLETLRVDIVQRTASPDLPSSVPAGIPELDSLIERPATPSTNRLYLLQLAALAYPRYPARPADRAWVRALRLAHQLPADAPGRRVLIARPLAHLGRRPAAMALLADPQTAAGRSLRELLNGNLPQAEGEADAIEDPVRRLIAQIELRDLRWSYGLTNAASEEERLAKLLPTDSPWWQLLHRRVSSETNTWAYESPADIIEYLRSFFPLSAAGEDIVTDRIGWLVDAAQSSSDHTDFQLALSAGALEYCNQWLAEHASELSGESTHGTWLLLDLLAAHIEADSLREFSRPYNTKGLIDRGREVIAKAERYFAGHPEVTALKASLEWAEYDRHLGAERAKWFAAALRDTEDAFYWAQRITPTLVSLDYGATEVPELSDRLERYRNAYFWDLPGDIGWLPSGLSNDDRARMHYRDTVLAYGTSQFGTFEWLLEQEEDDTWLQPVRESLRGRFSGNPGAARYRAEALHDSGDLAGAEREYRRFLAGQPADYNAYDNLAEVLVEQGRFAEAFEIVESYPGWDEDSGDHAVGLSNNAEFSAMLFYRVGQFDYAMPLLHRSADYDTGSSASMTSQALIAQHSGDYRGAARIRMQQARRYRNFNALNNYLALAFALGDFNPAWAVFEEVHRDGNGGQVASTMARSVRAQGWTDEEVREWLSEGRIRSLADETYYYAAHAAVAAFVIERAPPPDFAAWVRDLQEISPYVVDDAGRVMARNSGGAWSDAAVCGPSPYGSAVPLSPGEDVDSHLVYFADAYVALADGDYAQAQSVLEEAAGLFNYDAPSCENVSYLFPYLALSAAVNDDAERLVRYLDTVEFKRRTTHYHLARAAIAGVAGREEEALKALDQAIYRWESNRFRSVPTRYLYADICRYLYELTDSAAYRERLLWWLDVHQRVHPAAGWAYAVEARFTPDAEERQRALAMTLLLDRNSGTVESASNSELQSARAWLVDNNPFR